MDHKRIQFLDVARGIAIICIVLGHLSISNINRFVFTFHIPVFYLITGYFLDTKKDINTFILRKIKTLIVPYFLCSALIIVASCICDFITDSYVNPNMVTRWIDATIYGSGDRYFDPFYIPEIGATWFLLATFWGSLALRVLLDKKPIVRLLSVIVIFLLCNITTKISWFPLSIQAGGTALLFMYIAHLFRSALPELKSLQKEIKWALAVFSFWCWYEFIKNFQGFWLVKNHYGRGVVDLISSLCACACIFMISWFLCHKTKLLSRFLSFLGKYSLIMLSMHVVELYAIPWRRMLRTIIPKESSLPFILSWIACKLIWDILMTFVLTRFRFVKKLFGYQEEGVI